MAGYKVQICGVNTAALPLLKTEEKELLLKKIKNGDTQARERFINGNLRLVLSIVQRFSQSSENIDDLFQIGCVGMIKAIDNFDISQGVQFSTYAVPMIIGEIKRYLRDSNPIRVSRSLRDTAYKAIYTKEALTRQHQKEPTVTEIADEIGVSKEDIVLAMEARFPYMNRSTPRVATRFILWIRSVTKKTKKKTGYSISPCMKLWNTSIRANAALSTCAFLSVKPRWKPQKKSVFHRHRSAALKKTHSNP